MATKVAVGNPLARDDSPDSLANLETLLNQGKVYDVKKAFSGVLEALLELRLRLPNLYHLEPKLLLIDTQSFHVTLIPSDDLFSRKSPHESQSKEQLRFISPEEL
jgi:hypothetical protein